MIGQTLQILWAFGRRNLIATLYLDIYRSRLSSRSCTCEEDTNLTKRAKRLRASLEDLGPVFIKLGQMLARRGDVFPPAYIKELESLQDHARSVGGPEIRKALEMVCICEHGSAVKATDHDAAPLCLHCHKLNDVFDAFEQKPLAVASLAQVHRATFRGDEVVVKILKPGVLDILNRDLAILFRMRKSLLKWIGMSSTLNPDEFHAELQRSLRAEVDLQAEGLHMDAFREHAEHGIAAPKVYWGFGRDDILVMELVEGTPLDKATGQPVKKRKELASRLAVSFLQQVFIQNLFHGDPHPGNLFLRGEEIVYIDFGSVSRLDPVTHKVLRTLLVAISSGEVEKATESLLELSGHAPEEMTQFPGLLLDVGLIVQGFKTGSGMRWSDRIIEVARRHSLALPRNVIGLAKSLVLIEDMALKLDPEFQLKKPLEIFKAKAIPNDVKLRIHEMEAALSEYTELFEQAPAMLHDVRQLLAAGRTNDKA